ncbi:molecular chaperone HtpG [bacterium]|nr:molecular chaperone HtpG [bacterium]
MTETQAKNYKFKAEVSQLLNILTHSLYTHRDVFIRELISNASDALDKVRLKQVMGDKVADPDSDLEIRIALDKDNKQITIADTGIGMTRDELQQNIGTIARSGTSEFLKHISDSKQKDINLIGRFGVGFYSVFMAAEKVEVISKSADLKEPAHLWISDGKGSFKIEPVKEKVKRGTTIKVFLREDAAEFTEEYRIKSTIEKYSNFVPFPIYVGKEQINTVSAIWREPKSQIKDKQYNEFFKFIAHQSDDAVTWMHFSADVPLQFHTLLFVPKTNYEMMGFGKDEEGIHLFVKRVLIDSHSKDILPVYLRFVRGVLESDDLPLNISRETLQENPYMLKIRNSVTAKFLAHLKEFAEKNSEDYKNLWTQHGRILKEGYTDFAHKEQVAALFRFNSSICKTDDELMSLDDYVGRMKEKQDTIYFLSGPTREVLVNNPALEIFRAKDIEVIYCLDPIDEFVLPGLMEYKEKKILSADQVDLDALKEIPKQEPSPDKETEKVDEKAMDKLARRIKDILGKKVETVRISERLVDSPAVLVGKDKAMSSQMEKIMHMVNQDVKLTPKVMEINQKHPIIQNMLTIYQKDPTDPFLVKTVNSLFHSVLLLDGSLDNIQDMASGIQNLLSETTKMYLSKKSQKPKK